MKATVKYEVYLTVIPGKRSADKVNEYLRGKIGLLIGKLNEDFPSLEGVFVGPGLDMTQGILWVETEGVK